MNFNQFYLNFAGKDELIKLITEKGGDANAKFQENWAPLHRATYLGKLSISCVVSHVVCYLTLVYITIKFVLKSVKKCKNGFFPLNLSKNIDFNHFSIISGLHGVAGALIDNKADINIKNVEGYTALHVAAAQGHDKVAETLLKHGADIKLVSNAKWTALHQAAETGQSKIIEILLKAGAEVDAKEEDDWTALMLAAREGTLS